MTDVLVLGAGFGGLEAATTLARAGRDVTLVDERSTFQMGLAFLQMVDGRRGLDEGARRIADAQRFGVRVVQARATRLDLDAKRVDTTAGALAYERLVLALGARLDPGAVPGVPASARNVYSAEGARGLHEDLARVGDGARVLILVEGLPIKCPPAPYEAAILAKRFLDERGVDATVTLASPEPHPLPVAGPACGATVREWVEERGVRVRNLAKPTRVVEGHVEFESGPVEAFDVLGVVPAHRPSDLAGLEGLDREGGWIRIDPATSQTSREDVWAVGDCTMVKLAGGKPLVKAGIMAEKEARVVARRILGEDARFDGRGTCFLELGGGEAVEVEGDFFALPEPVVAPKPPSTASLERKAAFEAERLERWFGPAGQR